MAALTTGSHEDSRCQSWLRVNMHLLLNFTGMLFGVFGGFLIKMLEPSHEVIHVIGFPGAIFMNMLKMLIVPLVVCSLISGLSQMDARASGKIGSRAVAYYALTTTHAVILGIILVLVIQPGRPDLAAARQAHSANAATLSAAHDRISALDKFLDLIRNMFPENIVRATFLQQETLTIRNDTAASVSYKLQYIDGMNILGLIVFCIVFGLAVASLGETARPIVAFFSAMDAVIARMVGIFMWIAPIGIASLIAEKIIAIPNLLETAQLLGMFILTVIGGLLFQSLVTLPAIYYAAARKNPYVFLRGLTPALLTVFGTSSSAATLPVTFRCLNEIGVDQRITKFVLPVGSTINMDGTALYEAVAAIFIGQINGFDFGVSEIIVVSITATLAAIGTTGIPSGGIVTMFIVLAALGLPTEDVSLVLAIDFLLDELPEKEEEKEEEEIKDTEQIESSNVNGSRFSHQIHPSSPTTTSKFIDV